MTSESLSLVDVAATRDDKGTNARHKSFRRAAVVSTSARLGSRIGSQTGRVIGAIAGGAVGIAVKLGSQAVDYGAGYLAKSGLTNLLPVFLKRETRFLPSHVARRFQTPSAVQDKRRG